MPQFGHEYFKLSPELLSIFDLDGNFIDLNPSWKKTLGWDSENFLQTPFINFVHPEDKDFTMEEFNKLFHTPGHLVAGFENRYQHKDGSYRWLQWSASLIKDGQLILCSARDITKEVEQRKLFETIVNTIPIMITSYDRDGTIEWINHHWTEVLGWSLEDLKKYGRYGKALFTNSADHEEAKEFMSSAPSEWKEFTVINKEGGVNHTVWTNIGLPNGKVIGIGQDIGEKKMQEELIRDQQARMISTAKLSSLGEMASGIAHEINNPLAIIKGKAFHLIKKIESGEVDIDFVKKELIKIELNSLRIVKIIKGLRTFSRHGDNDPYQSVTFKSILDDVMELCQEKFTYQGVELRMSGDQSIEVNCQITQIAQVLLNLINNAHDAVASKNNPWVEIHIESNDQAVIVNVTDSGPGITEEVAQKIMQPFFTTKDVGTGTGLGLSISKGIVEMHGGTLFLDRYCANTRFVIQLPLTSNFCKTGEDPMEKYEK